ncbi:MAG: hypothetical protein D6694_09205 [Gammaproteobacteria bacterium]|nr:MAG: hypothetical protein D6694_09205 [Gammaproteobacteria bacterium]
MRTSLTAFCKSHGLPKTTVYRDCQRLGIDTANGLDDEAIARLNLEYGIVDAPAAPEPAAIAPDEIVPTGFIRSGQLPTVESRKIILPAGFDPNAMVRLFDGVVGQSTDTEKLLAIADRAIEAACSAMDAKVQEQRERLSRAERDAETLAGKIAAARTDLTVKALESRLLAERQTSATQRTEDLFGNLMAMGKPDSGDSQP